MVRPKRYRRPYARPVEYFMQILSIILDKEGKSWTNEIHRETGRAFKKDVINDIKDLEKLGFVNRKKKEKYSDPIKEYIIFTGLGKNVAELIKLTKVYNKKYFDLLDNIEEKMLFLTKLSPDILWKANKYEIISETSDRRIPVILKMHQLGWNEDDIVYYQELCRNILNFKQVCDRNFFFILQIWFFIMIRKYDIKKEAKRLIANIFSNLMEEKLMGFNEEHEKLELKGLLEYHLLPLMGSDSKHQIRNRAQIGVFTLLYDLVEIFVSPVPFVLEKQIREMLRGYYLLIKPILLLIPSYSNRYRKFSASLRPNLRMKRKS